MRFEDLKSRLYPFIKRLIEDHFTSQLIGTAFPTQNVFTGRLFYRTDLQRWYHFAGVFWYSNRFFIPLDREAILNPITTTSTSSHSLVFDDLHSFYSIEKLLARTYVATTNNGTNYWTCTMNVITPAGAVVAIATMNTSAIAANTHSRISTILTDVFIDTSIYSLLTLVWTKTGTPGNLFVTPSLDIHLLQL